MLGSSPSAVRSTMSWSCVSSSSTDLSESSRGGGSYPGDLDFTSLFGVLGLLFPGLVKKVIQVALSSAVPAPQLRWGTAADDDSCVWVLLELLFAFSPTISFDPASLPSLIHWKVKLLVSFPSSGGFVERGVELGLSLTSSGSSSFSSVVKPSLSRPLLSLGSLEPLSLVSWSPSSDKSPYFLGPFVLSSKRDFVLASHVSASLSSRLLMSSWELELPMLGSTASRPLSPVWLLELSLLGSTASRPLSPVWLLELSMLLSLFSSQRSSRCSFGGCTPAWLLWCLSSAALSIEPSRDLRPGTSNVPSFNFGSLDKGDFLVLGTLSGRPGRRSVPELCRDDRPGEINSSKGLAQEQQVANPLV